MSRQVEATGAGLHRRDQTSLWAELCLLTSHGVKSESVSCSVVSGSWRLCPWDCPGRRAGVGCRFPWRTRRPSFRERRLVPGPLGPACWRATGPGRVLGLGMGVCGGLSPGEAGAVGPAVGLGGDPQAPLKMPPSFWAKLNRENST